MALCLAGIARGGTLGFNATGRGEGARSNRFPDLADFGGEGVGEGVMSPPCLALPPPLLSLLPAEVAAVEALPLSVTPICLSGSSGTSRLFASR